MKTLDKMPTNKIQRASKLMTTGVKVGGNYLKYYGKKLVNSEHNKDELNESNAEDIYDSLKNLKGSALKVAQMLSMEKNIMPKAYVENFSLAQFQVPLLSAPLVRKTFKIQYPGVAESISSDLALVKPVAIKIFNLKGKDSEKYFKEIEGKLLEETNYVLEVKQSIEITKACEKIPDIRFPKYYPELSNERIITID